MPTGYPDSGNFPEILKSDEIISINKNKNKKDEKNHRPLSIWLSIMSKVYERCMQEQMNDYFVNLLFGFK